MKTQRIIGKRRKPIIIIMINATDRLKQIMPNSLNNR